MSTINEQVEQYRKLPSYQRVAGYILISAKLSALSARLRANGREDETWTADEEREWEGLFDESAAWWLALTPDEINVLRTQPFCRMMGMIARGKDVVRDS